MITDMRTAIIGQILNIPNGNRKADNFDKLLYRSS